MVLTGTIFVSIVFIVIVWMTILTLFVFRMIGHYNRLTAGITKTGLRDVLESLLGREEHLKKQLGEIGERIARVEADGTVHIQRLGIVRFNPFSDTGGSQSFSLALLDAQENGIVITSLYARTGNRWYVKEIRDGKGKDLELSKEEQSAIKKAHQYEYKTNK